MTADPDGVGTGRNPLAGVAAGDIENERHRLVLGNVVTQGVQTVHCLREPDRHDGRHDAGELADDRVERPVVVARPVGVRSLAVLVLAAGARGSEFAAAARQVDAVVAIRLDQSGTLVKAIHRPVVALNPRG